MQNISNLRCYFHLSFHIKSFKAVGITEFQDLETFNCLQDSERNEGELLTGMMRVVMLPLK